MDTAQKDLLRRIMALEFTALEFNLYLDTHPDDEMALADFNAAAAELARLKEQYEARYGPLFCFGWGKSAAPWQWIEEPWPWEISF
ncbi:MAG: spore coat protein CotJB [Clostridia bacterium]|nr:spore coat protein CotJB [Clostridia bacterium]